MDLQQLRAAQHDDLVLASDHALHAFLASCDPADAARDRAAHATRVERRMLTTEGDR